MRGIVRRSTVVLGAVVLVGSSVMVGARGAQGVPRSAPPPVSFSSRGYGAGPSVQQAVAADVNGDGNLDLAGVNEGAHTISLLYGRGDGTFEPQHRVPAGMQRPSAIATAAMNGDGNPDLVVVNGRKTDRVAVLLGDGAGGFTTRRYAGGRNAQAVITADLNEDSHPDVIVADGTGGLDTMLGRADGSLMPAHHLSTRSTMCSNVAAADLNGDGHIDLVSANSYLGMGASEHSVTVRLGNGDGTFRGAQRYRKVGVQPTMVGIADLNGDGELDLVTPNGGWPVHDVSIMYGNGDGTFAAPIHRAAGPSPHAVATADLNGDGTPDLSVTNLGTSYRVPTNDGVVIRLGRGDGSFTPTQQLREMWPTSITAADLDGDGAMDLIVPNESSGKIVVFINRG